MSSNVTPRKLPSGFKQVEYIESSGEQYINTRFIPKSTTAVMVDVMPLAVSGYSIFGYYNSSGDCFRLFNASSKIYLDFGATGANRIMGGSFAVGERKRLEFGNLYVKDADTGGTIVSGNAVSAFEKTTPLYLNGNNNYSSNRWYACQIGDNNTLARDYVPCITISGEAGMYDVVTDEFLGNEGTGAFTAGPLVITTPDNPSNLEQILSVYLRWSGVDCEGYNVYRNGTLISSTTNTFFADIGIDQNETYTYSVAAFNGALESGRVELTVYTRSGYFVIKPLIQSAFFQ